jgi:AraC family transcriptional regulator
MESFRQHFHCTVGDYVRRLRVEYAIHLLSTSDMSAAWIAHTVGFADQSHFCRTFKRLTGMTPLQFQKISRGDPSFRQKILF